MEGVLSKEVCAKCGHEHSAGFKFCSNCGKRNFTDIKNELESESQFYIHIQYLVAYSLLSIILLLIIALNENTFKILIFWTACFAIIDIVFASMQMSVWKLLKVNTIKILPFLSIVGICIGSAFLVSYTMNQLNLILFQDEYSSFQLFQHLEHPLLYAIIIVAVFPAFFEELAFRGFVFDNLNFIGGEKSAIWGSAFLFALVHFSLLSLIWLIPFALILSHYRKKYSTLTYGIIGHFIHNATTILIEYYELL